MAAARAGLGRILPESSILFLCDMQEKLRDRILYFPQIVSVAARMLKVHANFSPKTQEWRPKPSDLGLQAYLPPSDPGVQACLPPSDPGVQAYLPPSDLGVQAYLPPSDLGVQACLPPSDPGVQAYLPPSDPGVQEAYLPPSDPGVQACLPPSDPGVQACLPPSDPGVLSSALIRGSQHNAFPPIQVAQLLDVPVLLTEQYPQGLGPTVPELGAQGIQAVSKTCFSMVPPLQQELDRRPHLQSVLLCGIETQVCILNTALDLLDRGLQVHVAVDACSSQSEINRLVSLGRMRQSGVFLSTSEALILQLVKDSTHPRFKEIQKIIKEPAPDVGLLSFFQGKNNSLLLNSRP
ncbi:hypothetical protein U0070_023956 [Myodes glareolus]|uniref:Isochorismatase-like domain-containing protein n=1 Tax=Myodes glareolus TaxID=447135 RepID=A0AAW0HIZ3_MYOGA